MDIFKIAGIAIIGALFSLTVKQYKPELAVGISIICGLILLSEAASGIADIFRCLSDLTQKSGINDDYLMAVIKITGISLVSQFFSEVCRDAGQNAIASKLEIAAKVLILTLTIPIINEFLDICIKTVNILN